MPKNFAGKVTITITAAETKNYKKATKEVTAIVKPSSTKLSSVKSGKPNELTIKWAKNTTGTGYQMQYAASSKFTGAKTVKLKSNQTSYTLAGLKEKRSITFAFVPIRHLAKKPITPLGAAQRMRRLKHSHRQPQ